MKAWRLVPVALALSLLAVAPPRAMAQSITLTWTAPGDDGNVGTATSYQMHWSLAKPDTTSQTTLDSWWAASTPLGGLPTPHIAGTAESFTAPGPFPSGNIYYFIMRAADEVPNWSGYSNVAVKFIPDSVAPARITDVKAP